MKSELKMPRPFVWHNATQFLGAMNDNVFQFFLIFFLTAMLGVERKEQINSWAGIVFTIPFLALTPFAGVLADRFSKSSIIVKAKIAELVIMLLGWFIFLSSGGLGGASVFLIYAVLFMMCSQSAFFGPCKYSIIPELVSKERLSKANSFLQGMTYLSIIIGTATAPFITDLVGGKIAVAGFLCVILAVAGVFSSLRIQRTEPAKKDVKISLFFLKDVWNALYRIRHDRFLILAVLGSSYFLLIGGFAKIVLIPFGMEYCYCDLEYKLQITRSGYLFVVAALGIGVGSYLAGRLSGRNVEIGIIPIGAVGLGLAAVGLGLVGIVGEPGSDGVKAASYILIALFGLSAGLYIVPVNSFIQLRAPNEVRGRVLASANFLGWIGVLSSALIYNLLCGTLDVPLSNLFLVMGIVTLALSGLIILTLPDFFIRLLIVLLTRTIYRIRVEGIHNVPFDGPALLVSNHVSWADAVVIGATQQRRVRFVMDRAMIDHLWYFKWIFKLGRVIPISAGDSPKKLIAALQEARQAMDDGYIVCVFAEGKLTRTGTMDRFRSGFEKIVKDSDYPIIPTYIGGLWGSITSHYHGEVFQALPKRLPYPVRVHFGSPLPSDASPRDVRWAIEELSVDYYNTKKPKRLSLGETFVKQTRRHWFKSFMSDVTGKKLNYGTALIGAVAIADKIKDKTKDQQNIGIFLPSSVAGALANLSTAMLNKTSVNLSYTASGEDRQYMIETAQIQTVLTSRIFLKKLGIDASTLPGVILMEELAKTITSKEKRNAMVKALFMPRRKLARRPRDFSADQIAAILFSSGSSGRPKGVQLSHHNILSNLEGALEMFRVYKDDRLCGILPLFHSFGLSCTLWLPILAAVGVSFVPNPLEAKSVGQTVREDKCSLLLATPTFLQNYLRRCGAEDFKTLRIIITGAEKLKVEVIDKFEEKFGVRPCEGYGATECSPLIALNVPDGVTASGRQVGTKYGTVGHTVPGLAVRVLDVETGEVVEKGESGLLHVKGPNVMTGYLKLPDKTEAVLQDGWYNTGDIVSIDQDGFVTILDRLSRFSKIGGEMVPHMTIEETVLKGLGLAEAVIAVTSIPDEKKGEQLVILYQKEEVDPDKMHHILAESGLPKLYVPKRDNLIAIDEIPLLGSGKLDMMKLKQIAREAVENKNDPE